jgi:hypothetical protein
MLQNYLSRKELLDMKFGGQANLEQRRGPLFVLDDDLGFCSWHLLSKMMLQLSFCCHIYDGRIILYLSLTIDSGYPQGLFGCLLSSIEVDHL